MILIKDKDSDPWQEFGLIVFMPYNNAINKEWYQNIAVIMYYILYVALVFLYRLGAYFIIVQHNISLGKKIIIVSYMK